ncbi:PGAP1-like protein [Halobacteroides halobius DSM 5150]|uniref:PGAP1-like protein n=1 Tax=Halobacteroides halobius (strain ATCC 35273 / DSM 5150 / MD-1) TaxID=748449 RepID=L0K7H0_HALHC|nr:alpha/beta hydrolase [Halobacteroides halobius]AGB41237.1 PGAP1-like protein [Halobacteroides halobius DSM 5150]
MDLKLDNYFTAYPIIFVHGIAKGVDAWKRTAKIISNDNYYEMRYIEEDKVYHNFYGERPQQWIWSISYYTTNPIEESLFGDLTLYAQRLNKIIDLIKKITNRDKVILVAHSMGGLVARKYMTLKEENWETVHKILTVGSPHQGVITSVGIVGQLKDLASNSEFIKELKKDWEKLYINNNKKWGVIGAIDKTKFYNRNNSPHATDSGGPGFVRISSSIPYNEWQDAIKKLNQANYNTPHFGFRLAVDATHLDLLFHKGTFKGIQWTIE